jgi:hypothetical protein
LSSVAEMPDQSSALYRFLRALVRAWFSFFSGTIRLLNSEVLPSSGAAILVVDHPANWREVLLVVAVFPRPVRCLINQELIQGWWRWGLARGLGMIPYAPGAEAWAPIAETCCGFLSYGELVAVFEHTQTGEPDTHARRVAKLAFAAEARHSGQPGVSLFPVHLLVPQVGSRVTETLVHADEPLFARDYFSPGISEQPGRLETLAAELERQGREHVFRPRREAVERFLDGLEATLKSELEDTWSSRPDGKQSVDGFRLDSNVSHWVEKASTSRPEQIIALQDLLDRCREDRRRWALSQLEVEAAAWPKSPLKLAAVWFESLLGLPLAVYGLVNHLVIGLILLGAGLLKRGTGAGRTAKWLVVGLAALGIYVVQILIVDRFLGRAAAGYYAPSLPLSGAYIWRYRWLLRHRTRLVLVSSLRLPRQAAVERRKRKVIIDRLRRALEASTETPGGTV